MSVNLLFNSCIPELLPFPGLKSGIGDNSLAACFNPACGTNRRILRTIGAAVTIPTSECIGMRSNNYKIPNNTRLDRLVIGATTNRQRLSHRTTLANTHIGILSVVDPIVVQSVPALVAVADRLVVEHSTAVRHAHGAGLLARRIGFLSNRDEN